MFIHSLLFRTHRIMLRYYLCSLLLVLSIGLQSSYAGWTRVLAAGTMVGRTLEIRSGHFFDENVGMVGAGSSTDVPLIFLTTDGGANWSIAITPVNGNGVVSSFFFRDRNNGFATIHKSSFPSSSIWQTSDGGLTWIDVTGSRTAFEHTCIYETSKALIVTSWDRSGGKGGFSTNGGLTWNEVFENAADHSSNGIGFVDDLHGLVTMGPASLQPSGNNAYATSDGGLTWRKVQQFNEAWSVYALKNTSTFFLAPEGDISGGTGDRNILRSDDYGQSFNIVHQFPTGIQLVGHIDGKGKTLYVQTRRQSGQGLFRSDDMGVTWKNVAGPSNIEDSRFVVTGCVGQIVYAFDNSGNIWKTTDGGDGTLSIPVSSDLTLSLDTLLLGTLYCSPVTLGFTVTNASCDSLTIDSLTTGGDLLSEFSISPKAPVALSTFDERTISITFSPNASGDRDVTLRIKGRRGGFDIDTTITIQARNQLAPELFIPPLTSVATTERFVVPIFIKPTVDTFTISEYRIHLHYNGDVVEPFQLQTTGTLSESSNTNFVTDGNDGMLIAATLGSPITETSDLTKPLINIVMTGYLSAVMTTPIEIDSFGTPTLVPRCPDVALPQSLFMLDPDCGDSILSGFLRTKSIGTITAVRPNPVTSGSMEVLLDIREPADLVIELLNGNGNVMGTSVQIVTNRPGVHTELYPTQNLSSGTYFLRLRDAGSVFSLYPIQIIK